MLFTIKFNIAYCFIMNISYYIYILALKFNKLGLLQFSRTFGSTIEKWKNDVGEFRKFAVNLTIRKVGCGLCNVVIESIVIECSCAVHRVVYYMNEKICYNIHVYRTTIEQWYFVYIFTFCAPYISFTYVVLLWRRQPALLLLIVGIRQNF